jgi:hypothetical protein
MSLFQTPVTTSDLTTLQQGIQFFTNINDANAQVAAINTPGTTKSSVFIYATQLLANNIGLSQVAMADTALMEGGTIAIGNTTTPNTLAFLSQGGFLQNQLNLGMTLQAQTGIAAPVFAAEALGLALASTSGFMTKFAGLSTTAFVQSVNTLTGVNTTAITGFVNSWTDFYSGAGSNAHPGLTVQQAAYGAAFGDAIGVALLNPTTANLQTIVSTTPGQTPTQFTPNTVTGLVANALIDIAEDTANGTPGTLYKTGVGLGSLTTHTPLQGEFGSGGVPTTNLTIVDIIPLADRLEADQNSEPSIAVNPTNPMQMVAAAFGGGGPYFVSPNGGTTWSSFGNLDHGDTSLAWSLDGSKVLTATLTGAVANPDVGSTINTFSSTVASGNFGFPINMFPPTGATKGLDQPWIETGPANHVYVGYNNTRSEIAGQTAQMLVSSDGGNNYKSITLDRVGAPNGLQDDPSVREAVSGNEVYAVFDRWTKVTSANADGTQYASQLVVVSDQNAGDGGFTSLGPNGNGVQVATPTVPFAGPVENNPGVTNTVLMLGQNRTDIGTAIAVNPSNDKNVVVAYSSVTKYVAGQTGVIQVSVTESTDGGNTWTQKYMSPDGIRSGDSSVAILANGTIGLLYDSYDPVTNKLSQHLVTTTNDFKNFTDMTLATESNSTPARQGFTYLGDYINLVAVGNTFYGAFSASNADNGTDATINPSNPASVIFQRSTIGTPGMADFQVTNSVGTPGSVPASIDTFFFKFTPPADAPLVGVAQTPLDYAMV